LYYSLLVGVADISFQENEQIIAMKTVMGSES